MLIISQDNKLSEQTISNREKGENIRQIDGSLAITALREQYLEQKYPSSSISLKYILGYGKIVVSLAIPKEKLLWAHLKMLPMKRNKTIKFINIKW